MDQTPTEPPKKKKPLGIGRLALMTTVVAVITTMVRELLPELIKAAQEGFPSWFGG